MANFKLAAFTEGDVYCDTWNTPSPGQPVAMYRKGGNYHVCLSTTEAAANRIGNDGGEDVIYTRWPDGDNHQSQAATALTRYLERVSNGEGL